jgi:Protein of unknown function (DUF2853)
MADANYLDDVAKFADPVDAEAVDGIVKHLGIALRSADASLVSCSDQSELDRVRESWLERKLGLTDVDANNAAIAGVCATMKDVSRKSRVTFYYLLAAQFGKLDDLHKAEK